MTTKLTSRLAELLRVCEGATPGNWEMTSSLPVYAVCVVGEWGVHDIVTASGREYAMHAHPTKHGTTEANARFIAQSRSTQPQLIEALLVAVELLTDFGEYNSKGPYGEHARESNEALKSIQAILCPAPEGEGE